MVAELLTKYVWLVNTFIKAGDYGLSLEEIMDKWEDKWNASYSRRSFNNHREAIEEVFAIRIECNRKNNRYYIRYSADAADKDSTNAWIINTFSVKNVVSLSQERLSGRVSVEHIPSGQVWLTHVLEAMKDNRQLKIAYKKYTAADAPASEYTVFPYAVKEYAKRWYLVGHCFEKKRLRVYGLDRITSLKVLAENFIMPRDFDVDDLFKTSYGIYLQNDSAKTILFRAFGKEVGYIRDLPVHSSQKEVDTQEEHSDFSIFVVPDDNLIMDFCKRGGRIEVISPEEVRQRVIDEIQNAASRYGINTK